MPVAYPVLLDVTAVRVVVVGGGGVAKRKVAGLLAAGATDVTVVSPALADDFPRGGGDGRNDDRCVVRHVATVYAPPLLAGARLVFAATNDPAVNAAVLADARAIGAWANRADTDVAQTGDAAPGDFVTPAKFDAGPVTVTVSAGSAALTAAIRDGLRDRFDPRWAAMAAAMTALRPLLRDRAGLSPAARAAAFRRLASEDALAVLDRDGTAGLMKWLDATA